MRAWTGPAILGFGFRPFFLLGAIWAALALVLWIVALAGGPSLPTAFDPVSWHAHEMLFGYLGAVLAGFLLTAVPNRTGRLPLTGWPLAALVGLWILGRIGVSLSALVGVAPAAALDLAFPVVLAAALGREILAGRNWRNVPVVALLAVFAITNALYHLSAAAGGFPANGPALRIGLGVAVLLIMLIGGRIVPSFTRNWLTARGSAARPVPFGRADRVTMGLGLAALLLWALRPEGAATAALGLVAGLAQVWRLTRWSGYRTGAEPLVWVLHAAYAFVPLGFLAVAAAAVGLIPAPAAEHVWMAGAIGLMTLAVMTRASLGHSGRPLAATRPIAGLYWALILSVAARFLAGLLPDQTWLLHLAAAGWVAAFGGFAVIYWPILTRPRLAPHRPNRREGAP
ncbi:NnrS family protein [Defluviimonas salinarum]|nr:NnrS family protein [Defluviimonas salinarum]